MKGRSSNRVLNDQVERMLFDVIAGSNLQPDPTDFAALDQMLSPLYAPARGPSLGELVRQHCAGQPRVLKSCFGASDSSARQPL